MKRSEGTGIPFPKNIVAPPGRRLAGTNPLSWTFNSLKSCLKSSPKRRGLLGQINRSDSSIGRHLNQAIVLGWDKCTNCWSPNCRLFLGLMIRTAAFEWFEVKEPGKAKSAHLSFKSSPGRSMHRKPSSNNTASAIHSALFSGSWLIKPWPRASPIIAHQITVGNGGRSVVLLCSSQTRRFSQADTKRPLTRGSKCWQARSPCLTKERSPFLPFWCFIITYRPRASFAKSGLVSKNFTDLLRAVMQKEFTSMSPANNLLLYGFENLLNRKAAWEPWVCCLSSNPLPKIGMVAKDFTGNAQKWVI